MLQICGKVEFVKNISNEPFLFDNNAFGFTFLWKRWEVWRSYLGQVKFCTTSELIGEGYSRWRFQIQVSPITVLMYQNTWKTKISSYMQNWNYTSKFPVRPRKWPNLDLKFKNQLFALMLWCFFFLLRIFTTIQKERLKAIIRITIT